MRERIARAMLARRGYPDADLSKPYSPKSRIGEAVADADAVLAAMREPDEVMLSAAKPEPTHLYGKDGRGSDYEQQMKAAVLVDRLVASSIWQAMIDAACDSGRPPEGEDSRSEAECEAGQSGAAKTAHRPNTVAKLGSQSDG